MIMRTQFMKRDCCSLSPGQKGSMCRTVDSLFSNHSLFSLPLLHIFTLTLSFLFSSLTLLFPSCLTQAALMGGTTMVMALVLPEQHCSLLDAYEKCRALADAKVCCDYALHVGVTWWGSKVKSTLG